MPAKNKWSIVAIGGVCAAILAIWAVAGMVSANVKEKVIIPCIDTRIDEKTRFNNEKLEVLYKYTMEKAISDGNESLWNRCVDEVQNAGKVGKIQ